MSATQTVPTQHRPHAPPMSAPDGLPGQAATGPPAAASGTGRSFWSVAAVFLVVMAGTVLPSPLFGLYEQQLQLSSLDVTVMYAIYSVGVVAALVILGRFGSRVGLRTKLAAGLLLSALSAAVFLGTASLGLLIGARVLSGLAAGLTSGSATSAMIGLGGKPRRARSAIIAVGVSFGGLSLGSAISGAVSEIGLAALKLPYLVNIILILAVIPALLAVPARREQQPASPDAGEPGGGTGPGPFASSATRRLFARASVAGGVGFAANGLVAAIAAVFLAHYLHVTSRLVAGAVLAILFLATAAGQLIVRRTPARLAPVIGCAGLIAGLAVLAVTLLIPDIAGLIAAAVITGASAGVCTGAGIAALAVAVPRQQVAKITSAYYIALYGSVAVPVIADGLIAQGTGIVTAGLILCAALVAAVGGVLVSVLVSVLRRRR